MNILMISNDAIGKENKELGSILLKSYLSTLLELNTFDYIVLLNSGVKIVAEDSNLIEDLKEINNRSKILACGTCVNYYELEDKIKVGEISNMKVISELIAHADKVVNL